MAQGNISNAFQRLSIADQVMEVTMLGIIIVVSLVGNCTLWIVILRSKALRTITSMFILGLSAAGKLNLRFNN